MLRSRHQQLSKKVDAQINHRGVLPSAHQRSLRALDQDIESAVELCAAQVLEPFQCFEENSISLCLSHCGDLRVCFDPVGMLVILANAKGIQQKLPSKMEKTEKSGNLR